MSRFQFYADSDFEESRSSETSSRQIQQKGETEGWSVFSCPAFALLPSLVHLFCDTGVIAALLRIYSHCKVLIYKHSRASASLNSAAGSCILFNMPQA